MHTSKLLVFEDVDMADLCSAYVMHKDRGPNAAIPLIAHDLGIPPANVFALISQNSTELDAAYAQAQMSGETAINRSRLIADAGLKLLHEAIDRGEIDPAELPALMKPAMQILEMDQRRALAEKDTGPMLVININDLPGMADAMKKPRVSGVEHLEEAVVIDAPEPRFGSSNKSVGTASPEGTESTGADALAIEALTALAHAADCEGGAADREGGAA